MEAQKMTVIPLRGRPSHLLDFLHEPGMPASHTQTNPGREEGIDGRV